MPLAIIGVIILLLKFFEVDPVAKWSWWWVILPFALLFLWWEVITKMIGWDKKQAEKKMAADAKAAKEWQKKERGF